MINASTHQGSETALRTAPQAVRRIGPRAFAMLVGVELLLLFGVLTWALVWLTPAATPYATRQDLSPVVEAIRGRVGGTLDDPLLEVTPGVSVRESNLRGLSLDGAVYYYYVDGLRNFDPLSRGVVADDEVEVLLRDESGPNPLVIYRLR